MSTTQGPVRRVLLCLRRAAEGNLAQSHGEIERHHPHLQGLAGRAARSGRAGRPASLLRSQPGLVQHPTPSQRLEPANPTHLGRARILGRPAELPVQDDAEVKTLTAGSDGMVALHGNVVVSIGPPRPSTRHSRLRRQAAGTSTDLTARYEPDGAPIGPVVIDISRRTLTLRPAVRPPTMSHKNLTAQVPQVGRHHTKDRELQRLQRLSNPGSSAGTGVRLELPSTESSPGRGLTLKPPLRRDLVPSSIRPRTDLPFATLGGTWPRRLPLADTVSTRRYTSAGRAAGRSGPRGRGTALQ